MNQQSGAAYVVLVTQEVVVKTSSGAAVLHEDLTQGRSAFELVLVVAGWHCKVPCCCWLETVPHLMGLSVGSSAGQLASSAMNALEKRGGQKHPTWKVL